MERRDQIAEAGIVTIARAGARGLTHRAVDAQASLPPGSTSNLARTRHDLIALVVQRLAARTFADLDDFSLPSPLTIDAATDLLNSVLDHLARRTSDQSARFALLFELRADRDLHTLLTWASPVRKVLVDSAESVLRALEVEDTSRHAPDLVGLIDAIMMYRIAGASPIDATQVIHAYLSGLARAGTTGRVERGGRPL